MLNRIILIVLSAFALSLTGCAVNPADDVQPILYNLGGITLPDDVGAFDATRLDVAHNKTVTVFIFAQPLPQNPGEPQRINPNFEFGGLTKPIDLVSAINGVVAYIEDQPETHDYEVFLKPSQNSEWTVGYDHVTDLQITKGQTVAVGDHLGKAALTNNGDYRYELQIQHGGENDAIMYCPTDLLDASVKTDWQASLDAFVESWNASYHAVYGDDAYATQSGGCLKPSITNRESQGL